jgi:hypothetical protein
MSAEDFTKNILKFVSESSVSIYEEPAKITRKTFEAAIEHSPYKGYGKYSTGHFMANWQIGHTINNTVVASTATQSQLLAKMKSIITDDFFAHGNTAYMVNSVPYANNVETGEGWGWPVGYAPVGHALAEFRGIASGGKTE